MKVEKKASVSLKVEKITFKDKTLEEIKKIAEEMNKESQKKG